MMSQFRHTICLATHVFANQEPAMNLDEAPESGNVRDTRGMGPKLAVGGVGGVILVILGIIFGPDVINQLPDLGNNNSAPVADAPRDDKTLHFTKKVLGTTEVVWKEQFQKMGK